MQVTISRRRGSRKLAGAVAAAVLVGAGLVGTTAAPVGAGSSATCPLSALKKAKGPVEITMWHSMPEENEATLAKLTDQFNSSQSKVKVKLVFQIDYDTTFQKYVSGLSSGDLPDLVQLSGTDQQQMIDTQTALPAQACAKADGYSFKGFLPRVLSYFTVQGQVVGMPFNTSGPVLIYNKKTVAKAGLDPEQPPATLNEVRSYAEKIKSAGVVSGAPLGLVVDPGFFEHWRAMANRLYVNNGNGRSSRATRSVINDALSRQLFAWMNEMVKDGLAETNPDSGGERYADVLQIPTDVHAMAFDTSAVLGTAKQFLESGAWPGVTEADIGVGPMPGPGGRGGVLVQGAGLFIVNKSSPEKQAAAWEYLKFLDTTRSQVTWATGTGYLPITKAAAASPEMKAFWDANPGYKVAYDQLLEGVNSAATAGAVFGPYKDAQDAIRTAENSMFLEGKSPDAAVKQAASDTTSAITDYNQRIGAG
jgi:sn-glycerol 3-phosphate transport system substrate-binding protein